MEDTINMGSRPPDNCGKMNILSAYVNKYWHYLNHHDPNNEKKLYVIISDMRKKRASSALVSQQKSIKEALTHNIKSLMLYSQVSSSH